MKCCEQIHLSTDKATIIPANPKEGKGIDLDCVIEVKGRKIKRSEIININPDKTVKVIIPKYGLVSIYCNHDLEEINYDPEKPDKYQEARRDVALKCNRETGGCGFKKTMGNDLWNSCHCECCDCECTVNEQDKRPICQKCSDRGYVHSSMTFSCKKCGIDITDKPEKYDGICSDCNGGSK